MTETATSVFPDSKKHYEILDGLRGVAAVIVVIFHILEYFSGGDHSKLMINHGYLAVDFFFLLSGFVVAHAYDDRWNQMSLKDFLKRRLIRLHPMIIVGMVVGALLFYPSEANMFANITNTSLGKLIIVALIGMTLLPVPLSLDIRGWGEMHPLNGPAWSLFFEYVANILYALLLRRLSNGVLIALTFLAALALAHYTLTGPTGDLIGGWSLTGEQLRIGFTRLLYPFLAGMLLRRLVKPGSVKISNAFVWCSLLIIISLSIPRIGHADSLWMNGLYEALVVIFVFPLIVFMGTCGTIEHKTTQSICRFLGDISYPIYITHYPIIYTYYAWMERNKIELTSVWPSAIFVLTCSILLAYLSLKVYDIPVRNWLTRRFIKR